VPPARNGIIRRLGYAALRPSVCDFVTESSYYALYFLERPPKQSMMLSVRGPSLRFKHHHHHCRRSVPLVPHSPTSNRRSTLRSIDEIDGNTVRPLRGDARSRAHLAPLANLCMNKLTSTPSRGPPSGRFLHPISSLSSVSPVTSFNMLPSSELPHSTYLCSGN